MRILTFCKISGYLLSKKFQNVNIKYQKLFILQANQLIIDQSMIKMLLITVH